MRRNYWPYAVPATPVTKETPMTTQYQFSVTSQTLKMKRFDQFAIGDFLVTDANHVGVKVGEDSIRFGTPSEYTPGNRYAQPESCSARNIRGDKMYRVPTKVTINVEV